MRVLLIAIGNTLRRDDGAGHRVIELLDPPPDVTVRSVFQLTPEIAEDAGKADTVVFVDASVAVREVTLEPVACGPGTAPISHSLAPTEVIALARGLFGFLGRAWLCHVPGVDFGDGEGLSETAESNARLAAAELRTIL